MTLNLTLSHAFSIMTVMPVAVEVSVVWFSIQ